MANSEPTIQDVNRIIEERRAAQGIDPVSGRRPHFPDEAYKLASVAAGLWVDLTKPYGPGPTANRVAALALDLVRACAEALERDR